MGVNKERLLRLEKERLGEERVMNCGLKCKITEYPSSKHITVEFENGKIVKDKIYSNFIKGNITDGKRISPMKHKSLEGEKFGKLSIGKLEDKILQSDGGFEYFYNCHCNCGRDVIRSSRALRSKSNDKSCGKCPKTIEETINYKYPKMVKYFKNINDTFKYKCMSKSKTTFVCDNCGNERDLSIGIILTRGYSCPVCSDKLSYPEKFIISLLNQTNFNFEREKIFDWAIDKRYDFYIPSLNCIIETHGIQHYEETNRKGARTLIEEQENDKYKKEIALKNGINKYIELNCRESNINYMIGSIKKSKISDIVDIAKIDFNKCEEYAISNMVKEVCNIWNNMENKSTTNVAKYIKLSRRAIMEYLKIGNNLGWCDYNARESCKLYRDNTRIGEYNKRKVKCIDLNLEFNSIKECYEYMMKYTNLNFIHTGISSNCSGKRKHYRNYHFEYIED